MMNKMIMVVKTANSNGKRRGFTLTELVVVIGVLVVLAAILIPSVITASKQATLARYDEHARTLFLAAETRFTNMFYNGELEALNEASAAQKLTTTKVSALVDTPDYADVRYMRLNMGSTPDDAALYEALAGQLADESLLSANICVEYSAKTGRVYSVCYSEEGTGFRYSDEAADGRIDISDRSEAARKANSFGYFGVEKLNVADISTSDTLELEYVRLVNSDMLTLEFKLSDASGVPPDADDDATYTVRLKVGDEEKYKITFKGSEITAHHVSSDKVTLSAYEQDLTTNGTSIAHCIYKEDYRYVLVLDAIDVSTDKKYSILKRYSGLGIGEMTASVVAEADGFIATDEITSESEHTLVTLKYGTEQENIPEIVAGTYDYGVANPRHLFNMRHLANDAKYVQVADADFAAAAAKGYITNNGASQDTGLYPTPTWGNNKKLWFFGSYTGSYNGTQYKIGGMDIRPSKLGTSNSEAVGLFGELYGTVTAIKLEDISASGGVDTGALAGQCYGNVNGAELSATAGSTALITGSGNVGGLAGLVGENKPQSISYVASLKNCIVTGGAVRSTGKEKSVGGMIGLLQENVPLVFEPSLATEMKGKNYIVMTATVTSGAENQLIGGIFGQNRSTEYTDVSGLCFNGTVASTHTNDIVGGIVSQVDNGTKYSDCALGKDAVLNCKHTRVGGIAGFAGKQNKVLTFAFNNCANYGTITSTSGQVGGIVGRVRYNTCTFDGCKNFGTVSTENATALYGTGGILGSTDYPVIIKNCSNEKDASVSDTKFCVGGILGRLETDESTVTAMTNCANAGTVGGMATATQVGGLVGSVAKSSKLEITNCSILADAEITRAPDYVGGCVGFSGGSCTLTISNCSVEAGASLNSTYNSVSSLGGIVGNSDGTLTITKCTNNAAITLLESNSDVIGIGGIVGSLGGGTVDISNCNNAGNISSPNTNGTSERIAGILGSIGRKDTAPSATVTVTNCENTGNITGSTGVAGIVGYNASTKAVQVNLCKNSGTITAMREAVGKTAGSAGGIGAFWKGSDQSITNCKNTGIITCAKTEISGIGGIVGFVPEANKITVNNCENTGLVGAETANDIVMTNLGGIAGQIGKSSTVTGCTTSGAVKPNTSKAENVGGIVGKVFDGGTVTGCSSSSEITVATDSASYNVGGIVGRAGNTTITGCTFTGKISNEKAGSPTIDNTYRGGIVGQRIGNNSNVIITDCWFKPGGVPQTKLASGTEARMQGDRRNDSWGIKLTAPTGVNVTLPAFATPTNLAVIQSQSLTVSWVAPTGNPAIAISGYRVEMVIDGAVRATQNVTATTATIPLSGLTAADSGKTVTVKVYSTGVMPESEPATGSITLPPIS